MLAASWTRLESQNSLKLIKQLNTLGVNYGIIFQIIDDNLDYFGGKENGKDIGQDFLEGKVTLPIILLLKKTSKDEKGKISTLFQKKKRTIKELKEINKLLQKYEIEQECREYAEKISVKSLIILNNFKNKQSQLLKELLVTSIKRES